MSRSKFKVNDKVKLKTKGRCGCQVCRNYFSGVNKNLQIKSIQTYMMYPGYNSRSNYIIMDPKNPNFTHAAYSYQLELVKDLGIKCRNKSTPEQNIHSSVPFSLYISDSHN